MLLGLVSRILQSRKIARQFHRERRLLRGVGEAVCERPSVLHFSIHKSATQYVKSILRRCALESGLVHVELNEYLSYCSASPFLDQLSAGEMRRHQHVFRPRGYLYSVFAGMVEGIREMEQYRRVLMMRDPRDALTSKFYSIAFSHPSPGARDKRTRFLERRAQALQLGLDGYVLSEAPRLLRTCRRYLELLVPQPGVHITSYEHMFADFPGWLDKLLESCRLDISPLLRSRLMEEASASRPAREDIHRHLRQVTPGDHRRKLRPETIARLNELFAGVLRVFGYA